jgi:hypothetical protein
MSCCICGTVKNCGPYLDKIFENMEKIGALFENYKIMIYYDESSDDSLEKMKNYQTQNPNFYFYVNKSKMFPYRTHNLAKGRNFCLDFVKKNNFTFFVMMDCDDVNAKNINTDVIKRYIFRRDWDALSFNTSPQYYDIWGLSIHPYYLSYNHFENNAKSHEFLKEYITRLLNNMKSGQLLPCVSSFNGFSIYRTRKFINTYYDGRFRLDLFTKNHIDINKAALNSRIVYKNYGHVDGRYEDCEHRNFHIMASQNSNAKIMISSDVVFS